MSNEEPIKRYPGESIDVTWDERLCIHVGECGRADGELFVGGRDPWCQPDVTDQDAVVDVVERCPTGALVYLHKKGEVVETADEQNTIVVANHGPLYVRGELVIDGAVDDMPSVRFRAALCRCGQSSNKPFCDHSHEKAGFVDRGAIGRTGPDYEDEGGPLRLEPQTDGPLKVTGKHSVFSATGRLAYRSEKSFFCRCGASKNKPFCDGSHKAAGFSG